MMKNQNVSSTYGNKKFKSQKASRITSLAVSYVVLTILALIWIIPVFWIILHSFRTDLSPDGSSLNGNVVSNFFPQRFGFDNYIDLFTSEINGFKYAFPRWMLNTLIVSVFVCIISTLLILSVAYCISKLRFKMRKPFMNLSMILGLFPGFMSMYAIYFLLKSLHLSGFTTTDPARWLSVVGLILAYSAGSGMGFQVAKGFFDVIPNSLVESAKLDGCSNSKIFFKIILPLSKPIIIYTALMSFMGPWMDFIFSQVIIGANNTEYLTVAPGLYNMMFGVYAKGSNFTKFAAGCTCVGIPITLLFMFLQRYYVEGVTAGAVKG